MSGTIKNWGSFERNMFSGMRGADIRIRGDGPAKPGVIASQAAKLNEGKLQPSMVKKVLLGIVTFGLYNLIDSIVHSVNEKGQEETANALKEGVSNVHGALSYLATMAKRDTQSKGAGGNLSRFGMGDLTKPPSIKPSSQADIDFLEASNCTLVEGGDDDEDFKNQTFVRTTMGGVVVDIGLVGSLGAKVRINGLPEEKNQLSLSIVPPRNDTVIRLDDLEHSLYAMEKDIVQSTDFFGGDMVEKVLTRYDRRLELEKTVNMANSVGVPRREAIKSRQLELCHDILTMRCGMSQDRIDYLDRDLAKQLAIQVVRGNVTSGPALDAHYDKIVSQRHIVDEDMLALYKKLDEAPGLSGKITLPAAAPQSAAPEAGRPTAQQQRVHDFAADLLLTEDISDYDKDVGKSGYLDGHRLKNVFEKHQRLIVSLMNERAANRDVEPADLASLDPGMRGAVVKLLDTLIAKNAADYDRAHAAYQRKVSRDPNCRDLPPERLTCEEFVGKLIRDFDDTAKGGGFKISAGQHEIDDLAQAQQFQAGIGDTEEDEFTLRQRMAAENASEQDIEMAVVDMRERDKSFDYRRHGMANFFAQVELELNKSIEEAMSGYVQANVRTMIANVFPQENPEALKTTSSLATIVADRASDPQMKLLKQTLDVYFERMGGVDKRNMMARLVRNTVAGAADGIRFGELLKGAGPILQKMLQGLDPDAFTDQNFKAAIADMRSNLAPIPEKAVKAQFADLIARSGGAIESISVTRALGAASVGQTFLCSVKMSGEDESRECVIKMLRPDAHLRALREAEVFRDVAKGIEGMSLTFEGKLAGIMEELDLTIEAANVKTGLDVYDAGKHKVNKTFANVASMRLSNIPGTEPTRGVMVLERAPGVPMDKFLEDASSSIASDKATAVAGIASRGADSAVVSMLEGAESLTGTYEDALAKHEALTNLTTIWIREGLFTKTGFYHGDLHAGNIMVPTTDDLRKGVTNGVTMIDFGNARKLSSDEQKNVIRIVAGAAGNEPDLFLNGLSGLLSADGKKALADNREEIKGIVSAIFKKGTASDAGLRMSAVFKLLQAKFSIEVPAVMSGFQSSQERLTVAMESMLRTMTSAEVARLDVILAAASKEGVAGPEIPDDASPAEAFAAKKAAALAYLNAKLGGDLTDDVRTRLSALKKKIEDADGHRPMSMMQCMVAVIKQNIVTSLKTLGTSSAKTVTAQLKKDGLIGGVASADPAASEKERRFVEIRP